MSVPRTAVNEAAWLLIPSEHRVSSKTGTKGKDREHFEEVLKVGSIGPLGPRDGAPHYPECTDQHRHLKDQMYR